MESHEYWLLDSVIVSPFPLGLLALTPEDIGEALNRPAHGMDGETLVQTLLKLWHDGYLVMFDGVYLNKTRWLWPPDQALLQAALMREVDIYYAVTERGGRIWEKLSSPQWHQFTRINGAGAIRIQGGDRYIVEELLTIQQCLGRDLVPETIEWATIQPWRATYWKTLLQGYCVQFRFDATSRQRTHNLESLKCCQRWYELEQWYTNPFALHA